MKKKEQILKRKGFKRKWLGDKSGYWWQKNYGKDWKICADLTGNWFYSEVRTYQAFDGKWKKHTFETDKYFTSFNKLIKWLESS
jgi:hypothetical protein